MIPYVIDDTGCTADELFISNQFSRYLKGFQMKFSSKSFRLQSVISFHYTNAVVTAGKVTPLVHAKPVSRNEERGTFTAAVFDDEGQEQVFDDETGKPKFRQYRIENCAFTADDLLVMGYCPQCKKPLADGCEYSPSSNECVNS